MNKVLKAYHRAKYILAAASDGDNPTAPEKLYPPECLEAIAEFVEDLEDQGIGLVDNQLN